MNPTRQECIKRNEQARKTALRHGDFKSVNRLELEIEDQKNLLSKAERINLEFKL